MSGQPKWPRLVQTRVSEEAFDKLNANADADGMSVATYLRRMILREVCRPDRAAKRLQHQRDLAKGRRP